MAYELRINGKPVGTYATTDEAIQRAREATQSVPDCEVEMIDTKTGHAAEPAATVRWREELANKVGF